MSDWNLIAIFLILFVSSAGAGAGFYIMFRLWKYTTGFDEQRALIKQRNCDHVWKLICRRCGLFYK